MIDCQKELNAAQYEAASALEGPVLVIAGAGSGKTRTIVYRLANMVQSGIPASSILLLTFTRKAANEMLERARQLLGRPGTSGPYDAASAYEAASVLAQVQGGTFHSFAYSVLRLFRPEGYSRDATVMDSGDALALLQHCKEELKAGKGDRSFPRNQAILGLLSKSRNREQDLPDILRRDSAHLLPHTDEMLRMGQEYSRLKREKALLDYDDLLFEFELLLRSRADALDYCRRRHRYIMVDEFQDTNLVQARITALIAGAEQGAEGARPGSGNIMAVGDDAQSIYAFRGANVNNILNFPKTYSGAKLIRLEENYSSTQPLLDLSNSILDHAAQGFKKHLFSRRAEGDKPQLLRPLSDLSQGGLAAAKVAELMRERPLREIAVLFRAGYQSYHLEIQLNKLGIPFRKYGGIRVVDGAHIKDVMSFVRLVQNQLDFTAFSRVSGMVKGIGPKTALRLHQSLQLGDQKTLEKTCAKHPEMQKHLEFLNRLRSLAPVPRLLLERVAEHYQPTLEVLYPDDHPRRRQELDALIQTSASYEELDLFIADLSLEDPLAQTQDPQLDADGERDCLTLSTIHSAKGLEWGAVLLLDLVEERFPSKHALLREEDYEEERRLMYVACTRAKDYLGLFVPSSLYDRSAGGNIPAVPSPFVREISPSLYGEMQEAYTGGWIKRGVAASGNSYAAPSARANIQLRPNKPRIKPDYDPYDEFGDEAGNWIINGADNGTDNAADSGIDNRSDNKADVRMTGGGDGGVENQTEDNPAQKNNGDKHGFCTHKIFGRGKIVKFIPPDKYQINFPGFGLKVIMGAYITQESD
ncbi:MAG: ATP-dependent helicase [Deltaproteobacteria bacterium]|jgi:DNA helicase-2/ATP-dependent DNA helicase PcrA|nr:ATP-dependent helicase [Deltaproteobacteria bacterium]